MNHIRNLIRTISFPLMILVNIIFFSVVIFSMQTCPDFTPGMTMYSMLGVYGHNSRAILFNTALFMYTIITAIFIAHIIRHWVSENATRKIRIILAIAAFFFCMAAIFPADGQTAGEIHRLTVRTSCAILMLVMIWFGSRLIKSNTRLGVLNIGLFVGVILAAVVFGMEPDTFGITETVGFAAVLLWEIVMGYGKLKSIKNPLAFRFFHPSQSS